MRKKFLMLGMVLVGSLMLSGCRRSPQGKPEPTPRVRKADVNVNQEPIANRPYVHLSPRNDGHAVTLRLVEVKKQAKELEYEIEYNSGSLVQGAFGEIDLSEKLPISKEILLGSCSTGGKCTFNAYVTGGTMTLRFGNPDYTLKNEWSFIEIPKSGGVFTSRDARFTVDATKAKLKTGNVIVFQSPGYPGTLDTEVISGPYAVGLNVPVSTNVTTSVRVPSDAVAATLLGWDGKAWVTLSSKITADKMLTYTGKLMESYVVVKK